MTKPSKTLILLMMLILSFAFAKSKKAKASTCQCLCIDREPTEVCNNYFDFPAINCSYKICK